MIRYTTAGLRGLPRSGEDGRSSIVDRLAETMREMAFAGQNATVESLSARCHLTPDEIRAFGPEAADLARARSVRALRDDLPRIRVPAGSRHHEAA